MKHPIIIDMKHDRFLPDVQRLTESFGGQHPEPIVKHAFIAVSGLPGTGKSYLCNKLAEKVPFIILESDALRKTLFPSPTYSTQESSHLFQACHLLIERMLKKGISVVLDATNLSERYRKYLYSIADRLNAKLILVRVEAPPQVVQERLMSRRNGADSEGKSDADWTVYRGMKPTVQTIRRKHYIVDTSRDITTALNKIVKEIRR